MYQFYCSYLWYKADNKKEGSQDDNPSREHCCTQINVAPQDECDEYYYHQYNTGDVYHGSDWFWVIEDSDLDFTGLEGKYNPHKL